jgi:ubiquitin-activating enzyme E1 C
MMYMGAEGVHSHTFVYQQKADCPVCTSAVQKLTVTRATTLTELLQLLREGSLRLNAPSLTSGSGTTLYMQKPPALEKATRPNLDKALPTLVQEEEEILVTDPILESINLTLRIQYSD